MQQSHSNQKSQDIRNAAHYFKRAGQGEHPTQSTAQKRITNMAKMKSVLQGVQKAEDQIYATHAVNLEEINNFQDVYLNEQDQVKNPVERHRMSINPSNTYLPNLKSNFSSTQVNEIKSHSQLNHPRRGMNNSSVNSSIERSMDRRHVQNDNTLGQLVSDAHAYKQKMAPNLHTLVSSDTKHNRSSMHLSTAEGLKIARSKNRPKDITQYIIKAQSPHENNRRMLKPLDRSVRKMTIFEPMAPPPAMNVITEQTRAKDLEIERLQKQNRDLLAQLTRTKKENQDIEDEIDEMEDKMDSGSVDSHEAHMKYKREEFSQVRNEYRMASAELEQAKVWATTLTENLNKLTAKSTEEKADIRKEIWKQTAALQTTNEKKNLFAKQITELKLELKAIGITPILKMSTLELGGNKDQNRAMDSDEEDEAIDVNELNDESIEYMVSLCRYAMKHHIELEQIFEEVIMRTNKRGRDGLLTKQLTMHSKDLYRIMGEKKITMSDQSIYNLTKFLQINRQKKDIISFKRLQAVVTEMGENEFFLRNIKDSGDFFGKQYDPDAEFWAGLKEIIKDMYDDQKNSLCAAVIDTYNKGKLCFQTAPEAYAKDRAKSNTTTFRSWSVDKKFGFSFQGEWNKDGQKHGRGIRVMKDNVLLGYWKLDKLDGHVLQVFANGTKILQQYKAGEKHGHFEKKDKDGNVEIQIFANNVQTNIENGKIVKRKSFQVGDLVTLEYDPTNDRCEPIRMILDYNESAYTEKQMEESEARLSMFEQDGDQVFETALPVIILNGQRYPQSKQAIRQVAGRMALYNPRDARETKMAEEVIDMFVNIRDSMTQRKSATIDAAVRMRAQAEIEQKVKFLLDTLEKHFKQSKTKFIKGSELILADFCAAAIYLDMKYGFEPEFAEIFQPYKQLVPYFETIQKESNFKPRPKQLNLQIVIEEECKSQSSQGINKDQFHTIPDSQIKDDQKLMSKQNSSTLNSQEWSAMGKKKGVPQQSSGSVSDEDISPRSQHQANLHINTKNDSLTPSAQHNIKSQKNKKHKKLSKHEKKELEKQMEGDQYMGHGEDEPEDAKYWKHIERQVLGTHRGSDLLKQLRKVGYFEWPPQPLEFTGAGHRHYKEWQQHKDLKNWYQGEWNVYGDRDGRGVLVDQEKITIGYFLKNQPHGICFFIYLEGPYKVHQFTKGKQVGLNVGEITIECDVNHGRTEAIRLMLGHSQLNYKEKRISAGQAAKTCTDKNQYRNGLPVATFLGKRHHNTTAILRTLGAHLGYYNLESKEEAYAQDVQLDTFNQIYDIIDGIDMLEMDDAQIESCYKKTASELDKMLKHCCFKMEENGWSCIAGSKVSCADFVVATFYWNFAVNKQSAEQIRNLISAVFDKYPAVVQIIKTKLAPYLKLYMAKRQPRPM